MISTPPAPPDYIHISKGGAPPTVIKVPKTHVLYHSGDPGDIVYSLLWVKHNGGGRYFVGPDTKWGTHSLKDRARYPFILPLIAAQPYIKQAAYSETVPEKITHNLNDFRNVWMGEQTRKRLGLKTLFAAYPCVFNTPPLPENKPWLTVDSPVYDPDRPVVIHRSPRYRNPGFPWREVVRQYAYKMRFVGFESEYDEWVKTFGHVAKFVRCSDALEMAEVIAGAELFIGNQSCPNAIALGLGVPVIQETDHQSKDCVFDRPNTQYDYTGIKFPKIGRRYVVPIPNDRGVYELGMCADADGLGDTLTVTPLAHQLKDRCVVCMEPKYASLATLFTEICPVQFTSDPPVFFHDSNKGTWLMSESKLRAFGLWPNDPLPKIVISDDERKWAAEKLKPFKNPLAFVPTCAPAWAHIRQKPAEFWDAYIEMMAERYSVIQFGTESLRTVSGATRMKISSLRELAALYERIGLYVGVDTGDTHLMLSVGGNVCVFHPQKQPGYVPQEFHYSDSNRAHYFLFDQLDSVYDPFTNG